jgi:hypothetical protein
MNNGMASFIARQKLLFMRGYGIIGIAGILFLIASQLQTYLVNYGITVSLWVMYPVAFALTWIAGYLEVRLGIYASENEYIWETNPAYKKLAGTHGKKP